MANVPTGLVSQSPPRGRSSSSPPIGIRTPSLCAGGGWYGPCTLPGIESGIDEIRINLTREGNMAQAGTLHDAFVDELRDTYDAEKQLIKALPKLAKAARSPELRAAFEAHLEETRGQVERLEEVFASLDEKARGKHCEGIAGIIEEGKAIMQEEFDDATMDACLIAAGQRAEHYEMAAYGTLVAWAKTMGHTDAAELLEKTLEEEKATDEKLTMLAEEGINQNAADAAHPSDSEEEEEEEEPAPSRPRSRASASSQGSRRMSNR
jgi:ferritin-like metal-binding protein YciE